MGLDFVNFLKVFVQMNCLHRMLIILAYVVREEIQRDRAERRSNSAGFDGISMRLLAMVSPCSFKLYSPERYT